MSVIDFTSEIFEAIFRNRVLQHLDCVSVLGNGLPVVFVGFMAFCVLADSYDWRVFYSRVFVVLFFNSLFESAYPFDVRTTTLDFDGVLGWNVFFIRNFCNETRWGAPNQLRFLVLCALFDWEFYSALSKCILFGVQALELDYDWGDGFDGAQYASWVFCEDHAMGFLFE